MNSSIIAIGITLAKMGVLGGVGAGIIIGLKWFGGFNPTIKNNHSKKRGGHEDDSPGERIRKTIAERG